MVELRRMVVWRQWLGVALSFIIFFVVSELFKLKFLVANVLFQLEGHQWALRHHPLTETLFHEGVRNLNVLAVIALIGLTVFEMFRRHRRNRLRRYGVLLLSVLLSFGLVNYLKAMLGMDCPWDLAMYGGSKPYFSVWSLNDSHFSSGRCFPSGHSSIGFAWGALYFFWRNNRPRLAKVALLLSLLIGFGLGLIQQLRGAHFFVDDVTTAFICWSIALFIFHLGKPHETDND